jgi:hypothetical protein
VVRGFTKWYTEARDNNKLDAVFRPSLEEEHA